MLAARFLQVVDECLAACSPEIVPESDFFYLFILCGEEVAYSGYLFYGGILLVCSSSKFGQNVFVVIGQCLVGILTFSHYIDRISVGFVVVCQLVHRLSLFGGHIIDIVHIDIELCPEAKHK